MSKWTKERLSLVFIVVFVANAMAALFFTIATLSAEDASLVRLSVILAVLSVANCYACGKTVDHFIKD